MFLIGLGVYTFVMIIVWGFFLVAKLNVYTFRTYSKHITPVTKLLAATLIILTFLGYYFIFQMSSSSSTQKTETLQQSTATETY